MKKWINEVQDGERVWLNVLLSEVSRGITSKGAPYLNFVLQDKSGLLEAKFWNVSEEQLHGLKAGMFVEVKGDILHYKDQLQMRVLEVHEAPAQDHDLRDYIRSASLSKADLQAQLEQRLNAIGDDDIRTVCLEILREVEADLYDYPAAAKNHHDFVGGLAMHILGMMNLAEHICDQYPLLQRDLLIAGVFLHDIGKLQELSGPIATEYTKAGKLLGHISIMQAKVAQVAERCHINEETAILLRHMVLAHHGVYEYGSPVLPMIAEAEVLYLIDNLDARMNTLQKAFDRVKTGEFTGRIFALESRSFYKHH